MQVLHWKPMAWSLDVIAAFTVTGSKYLATCGSKMVLVDCGLFQGFKHLRLKTWVPLPIPPMVHRGGHPDPCPRRPQWLPATPGEERL